MFLLKKPTGSAIAAFIDSVSESSFSYQNVGLSLNGSPSGYNVDHNRICIGQGESDLMAAKEAIKNWTMFDLPWVELCWPNTPIQVGKNVAIVVNHFGFWSMNAARIVYVIEEPNRFGFAYGTLAEHVESGEERFSVEFDTTTGDVWYDLFAFSRPSHLLAKLGLPISRYLQKRFAADSMAAMKQAVAHANIS
jgi:uncharacterized protein (UPF0548 family)